MIFLHSKEPNDTKKVKLDHQMKPIILVSHTSIPTVTRYVLHGDVDENIGFRLCFVGIENMPTALLNPRLEHGAEIRYNNFTMLLQMEYNGEYHDTFSEINNNILEFMDHYYSGLRTIKTCLLACCL